MKTAFAAQRWSSSVQLKGKVCLGTGIPFIEYCFQPREETHNSTLVLLHTWVQGYNNTQKNSPHSIWTSQAKSSFMMLAPAQKETDEQFSFRSAELQELLSAIMDCNCLKETPQCPSPEVHPKHHTFQELPSLLRNINTVTVPVMSVTLIKSTKVSPRKSP